LTTERLFDTTVAMRDPGDAVPAPRFVQRTLDDLGTPLSEVTFCVIDLETTGGTATDGGITEIGAVKLRGGECLGRFQTLVNPGALIPPFITVLTGITQAMVMPAPHTNEVLPSLLEFIGDAVIVGHNVRYDLGYLDAALERTGRPRLSNRSVDTCALARRLVRDEVPNCKLGTLADRFRLDHQPSHRALDDALATGDLLHFLLERAAAWGVLGLDDLLTLPKLGGHPQADKLRFTEDLPRSPGVYIFRDRGGRALYVGKATNLRSRVRSYFSGDERRKIGPMLRETAGVDHIGCATPLEAAVLEVRLIHQLEPRFNRQAKTWRSYAYVKLTNERFPRLSVVRRARPDGARYLGPLSSTRAAQRVIEAVQTVVPLRRCTAPVPVQARREGACAAAQLGVALCPCTGGVSETEYRRHVDAVVRGFTTDPSILLGPLEARMVDLAAQERFEEAADLRDRADALATALRRQRRFEGLWRSARVVLDVAVSRTAGGDHDARQRLAFVRGELVEAGPVGRQDPFPTFGPGCLPAPGDGTPSPTRDASTPVGDTHSPAGDTPAPVGDTHSPVGDTPAPAGDAGIGCPDALVHAFERHVADELACVAAWLDRHPDQVRLVSCDGALATPLPPLPQFRPTARATHAPRR
jgi:DNA polymerase-3 subunit epsilon